MLAIQQGMFSKISASQDLGRRFKFKAMKLDAVTQGVSRCLEKNGGLRIESWRAVQCAEVKMKRKQPSRLGEWTARRHGIVFSSSNVNY